MVAQKCGVVRQTRNGKTWLEGRQKRCAVLRYGLRCNRVCKCAACVYVNSSSGHLWVNSTDGRSTGHV